MNDFDPSRQVAIIWSVEDVHSIRANLTDEQAMEVLQTAKYNHDANLGITWDTLEFWVDTLYPVTK